VKKAHEVIQKEERFGGYTCLAKTNLGHDVPVWMPPGKNPPTQPLQERHIPLVQRAHRMLYGLDRYLKFRGLMFCHGHSLGTFTKFGYSVYGGPGMETVLKDEYMALPAKTLKGARAGNIIVWRRGGMIEHSAKLEIVPVKNPTLETTKISSKDTYSGFSHEWLSKYMKKWGKNWQIYRRK
jgi:hypothetical protein